MSLSSCTVFVSRVSLPKKSLERRWTKSQQFPPTHCSLLKEGRTQSIWTTSRMDKYGHRGLTSKSHDLEQEIWSSHHVNLTQLMETLVQTRDIILRTI